MLSVLGWEYIRDLFSAQGENGLFQSVLLKEVVIEPNVKLECVPTWVTHLVREEAWRRRQEPE